RRPALGRVRRRARARRGRPAPPPRRGPGDAPDLPRGVRDGRGRGRRLRCAPGLGRPLRNARGLPAAFGLAAARGGATDVVPDRARRGPGDRRSTRPLARSPRGDPRRGSGDARRHRRAPLELGGSGPRSAPRSGRKPKWGADRGPLVGGTARPGKASRRSFNRMPPALFSNRLPIAKMAAAVVALAAIISAIMLSFNWNGAEDSTAAPKIDDLLNIMIVLSSIVFAVVVVALGYALIAFRAKPGDESDGEPIHGNTRLEI